MVALKVILIWISTTVKLLQVIQLMMFKSRRLSPAGTKINTPRLAPSAILLQSYVDQSQSVKTCKPLNTRN